MNARLIALVGAVILVAGHFLPVFDTVEAATYAPKSINFILVDGQLADGIVTAGLALVAIILALLNMTKHALWPALLALCYLAWRFFDIKAQVDRGIASASAEQLEQLNGAHIGPNYLGWGVMVLGLVVLIAGCVMAWKRPAATPPAA